MPAPRLRVDRRPTDEEITALISAVPPQPHRVAVAAAGNWEPAGWWGPGRPVSWADAIQAARVVATAAKVDLDVRADVHAPWHPGRCAALFVGDTLVGHAGELHPRVIHVLGLPDRTVVMELEIGLLGATDTPVPALLWQPSRWPPRTWRWSCPPTSQPLPSRQRCAPERVNCWSRCGCSTCTRATGRRRAQVAGLYAALPGAGSHPHRRRDNGRARRRHRRNAAPDRRSTAQLRTRQSRPSCMKLQDSA